MTIREYRFDATGVFGYEYRNKRNDLLLKVGGPIRPTLLPMELDCGGRTLEARQISGNTIGVFSNVSSEPVWILTCFKRDIRYEITVSGRRIDVLTNQNSTNFYINGETVGQTISFRGKPVRDGDYYKEMYSLIKINGDIDLNTLLAMLSFRMLK